MSNTSILVPWNDKACIASGARNGVYRTQWTESFYYMLIWKDQKSLIFSHHASLPLQPLSHNVHLSVFLFVFLCQPPLGMSKSFDLSLWMGKNTNFKYTTRISLVKAMATTITTKLSQDSVGCLFTSLMTRSTGVVHDLYPVMNWRLTLQMWNILIYYKMCAMWTWTMFPLSLKY